MKDNARALALSALRPELKSIPPSRSSDGEGDAGGLSEKSRYYRALWRHAVEVVLRVSCPSFAFTSNVNFVTGLPFHCAAALQDCRRLGEVADRFGRGGSCTYWFLAHLFVVPFVWR